MVDDMEFGEGRASYFAAKRAGYDFAYGGNFHDYQEAVDHWKPNASELEHQGFAHGWFERTDETNDALELERYGAFKGE